ncbi:carbon-nitrogen hydrolase family protein [Nocardia sp. CDC160]|uniref:carbon-nitrogen hydrolase family protein n=1 Tax=Nocardia sp. CDC160 TaxID=3112166 RepID=UPI002DBE045A|nr:carbon-nitrogen hydrolase family protein [Nocardia sp. CDC160]MEC3917917.1 carbon-nitrogen hydrolase family protein [Nocardia sp. CDC160]
MRIAVAQLSASADVQTRLDDHVNAIDAAGARVVVFPELSLTGYALDATPIDIADSRFEPIVAACKRSGSIALVGAPVREGDHTYIAMLAVDDKGVRVAYRKTNLFPTEVDHYAVGPGPVVLPVDGWQLGLAICYDTYIESHASDTVALGIDVYVAGVVDYGPLMPLPERAAKIASQHQIPVAIANSIGPNGGYESTGGSGIWAADGTALALADELPNAVAVTVLS